MVLAMGLSYMAFIILNYIPSLLNLFSFDLEKIWIFFSDAFSASIEIIKKGVFFMKTTWRSCYSSQFVYWFTLVVLSVIPRLAASESPGNFQ